MKIPYSKVDCGGSELDYVAEVLRSGWLTTASKARELEERFRDLIGCRHALAVNSCTSALHLALDAVGVQPGHGVFVPSLTFTSSAEVIRYMGAGPVVIDGDPDTSSITADILEAAIERRPDVKALVAVHFGGLCLPMSGPRGLVEICNRHGIRLVEDAAHALPSSDGTQLVGRFGDVTCFSFYANKTMTTGEGGMVTTDSDALAARIRTMRLHGIDRDVWDRFTSKTPVAWEYDVIAPGFKYNMPDINAAVGLAQFERLGSMHAARISCARIYAEKLADHPYLALPAIPPDYGMHSWHLFPVRLTDHPSIDRNELIRRLGEEGVGTSVHYKPIHRLSYYRDTYGLEPGDFPGAEAVWRTTVSLPIYSLLESEEVAEVCATIDRILEV